MCRLSVPLAVMALVLLVVPQFAVAADTNNSIGFSLAYVSPTGDYTERISGDSVKVEADSALGFDFNYQYRLSETFSFGASLLYANHDIKVKSGSISAKIGDTTFTPLLFDGNFHLVDSSKPVDFYLGPTLGYAMWGDFKPKGLAKNLGVGKSKIKNSFVYGVNFGVDVPFADTWAFNAGLRYLLVKAEIDESGAPKIDVNPLVLTAGVSYRF